MDIFKLFGTIVIDGVEAANKKIESVSKKAKDVGEKFKTAGEKISGIGQKMMPVSKAVAGVGAALVAAAESSREYRTDMGKLETAFTTMGHTTEAATQTYKGLQAVLGETDQSVEAANHLAKLCDNEKDLQTWTEICTGVFATFGDSLPIEGLTEAANETAKVGQVVGPLADALNWAGIAEDEFNQKLAACNSEQERAALITETMNGLYSEAANKYKELNGEVMNANSAQDKWRDSMAKVGEIIQPYIDGVVSTLAGVIGKVAEWFGSLSQNTQTFILVIGGVVAAIGPVLVVIGTLISSIGSIITILPVLGAAFGGLVAFITSPIGAITLLVGAFVLLWNKCEEFRNFWKELWENIKEIASNFLPALRDYMTKEFENIKAKVQGIWENIKSAIAEKCSAIQSAVSEKFQAVKSAIEEKANAAKQTVSNVFSNIQDTISQKVEAAKSKVSSTFASIKSEIESKINAARNTVQSAIDKIKAAFNFTAQFKIRLPRISVSGGVAPYGIGGKGSLPRFSVTWYKKAMENAMILNKPTIFGYSEASGKLLGGGEAGNEVVAGQNTLMGLISNAVAEQNAALEYYLQTLVKMLADYFPQILEAAGHDIVTNDGVIVAHYAPQFDKALGKISAGKDRGR